MVAEEPRARVVGGCSAHNECAAVWPPQEDLDAWELPGWSANDLWPLVQGIERASGGSTIRGRTGPLVTRQWRENELTTWQSAFIESALAEGYGQLDDASAASPDSGVAAFHANIKRDVRWNAAFAFLDPVRGRRGLDIHARTEARRLVSRAQRAVTLVCRRDHRQIEIRADRYVVSCGTFGSPLLLLRSGIRSRELGRGLQDHPGVALTFRPRRGAPSGLRSRNPFRSQVVLRAASGTTRFGWDFTLCHIRPRARFSSSCSSWRPGRAVWLPCEATVRGFGSDSSSTKAERTWMRLRPASGSHDKSLPAARSSKRPIRLPGFAVVHFAGGSAQM